LHKTENIPLSVNKISFPPSNRKNNSTYIRGNSMFDQAQSHNLDAQTELSEATIDDSIVELSDDELEEVSGGRSRMFNRGRGFKKFFFQQTDIRSTGRTEVRGANGASAMQEAEYILSQTTISFER
jgi:hypothetical protein